MMAAHERPMSPHLQIYRWQITNTLSIVHRLTGFALSVGLLVLVSWLVALAAGPEPFARVRGLLASFPGQAVLLGLGFCLFFHLGNGIRHLAWDCGWGLELPVLRRTGWIVVLFSVIMTGLSWWLVGGGA